jgi:hypothetical protein
MGDENVCGVRRGVIGPQLNVGRSDAQHKSAESFLTGLRCREQEYYRTGVVLCITAILSARLLNRVINGHSTMSASRLLYPRKRTFAGSHLMSALGQKQTFAASFDRYLVG